MFEYGVLFEWLVDVKVFNEDLILEFLDYLFVEVVEVLIEIVVGGMLREFVFILLESNFFDYLDV